MGAEEEVLARDDRRSVSHAFLHAVRRGAAVHVLWGLGYGIVRLRRRELQRHASPVRLLLRLHRGHLHAGFRCRPLLPPHARSEEDDHVVTGSYRERRGIEADSPPAPPPPSPALRDYGLWLSSRFL